MSHDPDDEAPTDRRVRSLLGDLGHAEEGASGSALVDRVVQTARWQSGVRRAIFGVGTVMGGLARGAAVLLGIRRNPEADR